MSVYSSVVTRGGVTVTVTINLERPYPDQDELAEVTGVNAARIASKTVKALSRVAPF